MLIAPTAAAIILLAIVQYRWSTDVSNAASVRLADSLQMSMVGWQLNLYRDLTDVCERFRLGGDDIAVDDFPKAIHQFAAKQASAEYADLVSAIQLVAVDPALPVLEWTAASGTFISVDSPVISRCARNLARRPP